MRFIGHKAKILDAIEGFLRAQGVPLRGTFLDAFAGTACVGAHFRRLGMTVRACDLLHASHALQVALLEPSSEPVFAGVLGRDEVAAAASLPDVARRAEALGGTPLARVLAFLEAGAAPEEGLVFRAFCPEGGAHERRYFTPAVARGLDAALGWVRRWHQEGALERVELHLLLAAIIEGADRVANTAGIYAAYMKTWQPNALQALALRPAIQTQGPPGRAHRGDAAALVAATPCDILYLDPPYNHRQYAANYHLPELLAEHHAVADLAAYEAALTGVTGMRDGSAQRSRFCLRRARGGVRECEGAFRELILAAQAETIVVSYNEEGLIPRGTIADVLAEYEGVARFDFERRFADLSHKRYRSDEDGRAGRQYRHLPGRRRDEVREWLFLARRSPAARRRAVAMGPAPTQKMGR